MPGSIKSMETWRELGQAIRDSRREAGLTQEQLAERASLHWTYVSEIETGRKNPSVAVLRRIAIGLDIKLSALIERAET
jgi:transcriptional regulator with XRE-family HTH domain